MWQWMLAGLLMAAPQTGPGGEVPVQARAIQLPPVPDSLEAARTGQARIRPALATSLRELEADLDRLYGQLGDDPPVIRLNTAVTAEILALESLLEDPEHEALRQAVFDRWNAWQTALLQCGLEHPMEASAVTSRLSLQAFPRFERNTRVLRAREAPPAPGPPSASSRPNTEFLSIGRMNYSSFSALGRQARKVAQPQARELALLWAALAEHLNARALAFLNLDKEATADPALRALRLRAKINFLERFRATLWLCQLVWAHMTSEDLPAPLADLWIKAPK